jgi:hypothetical protein
VAGRRDREAIAAGWPRVAEVACGSGDEPADGEPAQRAWGHGHHGADFVWRTQRRWAGSCRQFMLELDDGTIKRADFRFGRHPWRDGWF